MKNIIYLPRNIAVFLIKIYQKTFSPDHGMFKRRYPFGYCKFTPTCSEYAKMSIKKYGVVIGGIKAVWRVLRCNPCGKGGVDDVK